MDQPTKPTPWWRRLEERLDAWAAKKLGPEELAEAKAADAQLKRNFWRWAGLFVGASAALGLVLYAIKPRFGLVEAMFIAFLLTGALGVCFVSAFFGYRRLVGPHGWRKLVAVAVLAMLGALTGAIVANLGAGRMPPTDPESVLRMVAIGLLAGGVLAVALLAVARMRAREGRQREARLASEAESERLSRQTLQAELKLLQAQVEPHFLFNTLANLRFLVQTGSPDALAMLDHLIHYLRMALPEIRAEGSTVEREVELARAFLEILRIRMGGALEVVTEVEPGSERTPVPPLMVMTLVENAIKHGVAPVGCGTVRVSAASRDGRLVIRVEDDGRGLAEPIGQGVGLANIRERLRALHGERAHLDLSGRPGGGTVATIEIEERPA